MKIKHSTTASDVPSPFVTQHQADVIGVLSGFDRLRLMATLRPLYQPSLMLRYLSRVGVLLKDFAAFASGWTQRVRRTTQQLAEQSGRPLRYLQGSSQRKELLARDQVRADGVTAGLIGIWSVIEPCLTYFVRKDREQKKLVLRLEPSNSHFDGTRKRAERPGRGRIGRGVRADTSWMRSAPHQAMRRPHARLACGLPENRFQLF